VDLIAALFAVATAYMAYFSVVIIKRAHLNTDSPRLRHALIRWRIAMVCYGAATLLFIISAIFSSTALLVDGVLVLVVSAISSIIFTVVRPRL
jgi:hypothetical protein